MEREHAGAGAGADLTPRSGRTFGERLARAAELVARSTELADCTEQHCLCLDGASQSLKGAPKGEARNGISKKGRFVKLSLLISRCYLCVPVMMSGLLAVFCLDSRCWAIGVLGRSRREARSYACYRN